MSLFDLITGQGQSPMENNLPVLRETETLKVLGPHPCKKTAIKIGANSAAAFEIALICVSIAVKTPRVTTGSFRHDLKTGETVYDMLVGQARRTTIPLQPISDGDATITALQKLMGKSYETEEVIIESGKIHCLIGLDGKLDGKSHTFSFDELVAFLGDGFVTAPNKIFAVNPEYAKYDDFGRYSESAASVTFAATPENVAKIVAWCKKTGQTRVGFEFGANFTNVEF